MKVLFCASEALPFSATGGLADVAGSLPQALRARLIGCRVVVPLYDGISQELRDQMHFVTSISVPVAWRRQYCGIFEAKVGNVIYYLIDNQYYFKRSGIYGHFDDAERFAFFSRAILEMLPYIDFKPDVIHANDCRRPWCLCTIGCSTPTTSGIPALRPCLPSITSNIRASMAKRFWKTCLVSPIRKAPSWSSTGREPDEGRH